MCNQALARALVEVLCSERGLYSPMPVNQSMILNPGPLPPSSQKRSKKSRPRLATAHSDSRARVWGCFTGSMSRTTTKRNKNLQARMHTSLPSSETLRGCKVRSNSPADRCALQPGPRTAVQKLALAAGAPPISPRHPGPL